MTASKALYDSLETAYTHFNQRLFDGGLPEVIFTVQRKTGVMGYFSPKRWGNMSGRQCDEIAINPSYVANSRMIEVMQTLVHEMVHCWQYHHGRPGRSYYHNKEWALKMITVGLMPSSTGEPGGEITGQHMSDYIIEDGPFYHAFKTLEEEMAYQLVWVDRKALPRLFAPLIADPNAPLHTPQASETTSEHHTVKDVSVANIRTEPTTPHHLPPDSATFAKLLPENFVVTEQPRRKTRSRYECRGCHAKVYGKASLRIRCEDCDLPFIQHDG